MQWQNKTTTQNQLKSNNLKAPVIWIENQQVKSFCSSIVRVLIKQIDEENRTYRQEPSTINSARDAFFFAAIECTQSAL
jgi:hypothetical protein